MRIVALETSTFVASVALLDGPRLVCRERGPEGAHSSDLLALVEAALAEAGVAIDAVDAVAVGAGPGSFTGLRIGMATAKGLAFAAAKPLRVVSSLAALALDAAPLAPAGALLVPVIDARRGEVFVGGFRAAADTVVAVGAERVVAPGELGAFIAGLGGGAVLFGDGLALLGDLGGVGTALAGARATPSAGAVARLAALETSADVLRLAAPVYLRPAEAELKFPSGTAPGGSFGGDPP